MVIFMGCGSSFSLAKSMAGTVNMRTKAHAYALPAGDAALHAGRYAGMAQGALIVPVSRSGSTSEVMFALDALRAAGHGAAQCRPTEPLLPSNGRAVCAKPLAKPAVFRCYGALKAALQGGFPVSLYAKKRRMQA